MCDKDQKFIEFIKNSNFTANKATLCRAPTLFFTRNNFNHMIFLIGNNYQETKLNIFKYVYGLAYCKVCKQEVNRFRAANKFKKSKHDCWAATCSTICSKKYISLRQLGANNTGHRMTPETKQKKLAQQSLEVKSRILSGEFTPKTNNYKHQRPIKYSINGIKYQARSLWELIYRLNYPELEYESIRLQYFDTVENKLRIYITDFFDRTTNTIIEVRPKAYQHLLIDKQKAVYEQGYNYKIVDEDYFNTTKTPEMIDLIESLVDDIEDVKSRLKWLRTA
jgi:hypothetical protein